jgi:3-oxoacyl-[acyl-carrier-protein] synthase-3
MTGSRVVATGHHQPTKILTNDDLAAMVDTSDEWITKRVGIRTRHVAAEDETVTDLAAGAAAQALAASGMDASEIDLVLVATCTQTERAPNVAARVAARLGVRGGALIDVGASPWSSGPT